VPVPVVYHYSNFEEFGHGASAGIQDDVAELIAVDMGALGEGLQGNEHAVSIRGNVAVAVGALVGSVVAVTRASC